MEISSLASQNSAASANAFSSLTQNFDTFLTLLTTQLRNQDPLNPLDTEKFTSQLVQFAGVEQSIKTNSHLEALIALQAASDRDGALGFVGRNVTVESDRALFDGTAAAWTYTLPTDAAAASFSIVDGNGEVVARQAGAAKGGSHTLNWDGAQDRGGAAGPGIYRLVIDAVDANGAAIDATVQSNTHVTAATFGADGASLETDIGTVALDAVRRVAAES